MLSMQWHSRQTSMELDFRAIERGREGARARAIVLTFRLIVVGDIEPATGDPCCDVDGGEDEGGKNC